LLSAQHKAGGIRFRDEFSVLIADLTFHIANRAASLDHAAFSAKVPLANWSQKIYFEFDSGERFAGRKRAGEGEAHRGVGYVTQNAAVKRTHRIEVLLASLQSNHGAAIAGFCHFKADQFTDGWAALHHALK
jgi:hypothetical protein